MQSPFGEEENSVVNNFENSRVVFVSDLHVSDYGGGAELSTDALSKTSPFGEVCFLRSRELKPEHLSEGSQKIWVFFKMIFFILTLWRCFGRPTPSQIERRGCL